MSNNYNYNKNFQQNTSQRNTFINTQQYNQQNALNNEQYNNQQNEWQQIVKRFQQEDIKHKDQLIQFLLSTVLPFITSSILQMQMQVYSKKEQLQSEIVFYKDYVLKDSTVRDSIYQKVLNKISWFRTLINSKFTQNIALSYVLAILETIQDFQKRMTQFYQTYLDQGLYQRITTKNIEQYLPSSIIDLINKDNLIQNISGDISGSIINTGIINSSGVSISSKNRKHVNLKMVGLPQVFQHRTKITEITELQMAYTDFYNKVYQRQWIKDHIQDPETFWTKPTIISVIYFYIYNQEINKDYYLCLSNIICSDEIIYIIDKMIQVLKM